MSKSAGVSGYLAIGDAFYSKHVQLKVVHKPGKTERETCAVRPRQNITKYRHD